MPSWKGLVCTVLVEFRKKKRKKKIQLWWVRSLSALISFRAESKEEPNATTDEKARPDKDKEEKKRSRSKSPSSKKRERSKSGDRRRRGRSRSGWVTMKSLWRGSLHFVISFCLLNDNAWLRLMYSSCICTIWRAVKFHHWKGLGISVVLWKIFLFF